MDEEKLYSIMLSRELTWEGLIRDIVQNENLNPWDIDIALLANRYLQAVRELKKADLRVSGKFLLAAAILLKMKSDYLFPRIIEEIEEKEGIVIDDTDYELEPHIPIPKKRKITLDELISSLKKALVVREKRTIKHREREIKINVNVRRIDISEKIANLYEKIKGFFIRFKRELTFSELIPSKQKKDIIWTFIPLVHLANKGKVKLRQEEDFGEIYVGEEKGGD